MTTDQFPVAPPVASRLLTAEAYQRLADVPPEVEWFANLDNQATRRAYENALGDFMRFTGIAKAEEFRTVTRAHVIAWRDDLAKRGLSGMTVRHRLAALSSLFEYLCERNAVTHNPVKGVKRPPVESYEGKTPALGDHQARTLLDAPEGDTLKSKRDRALLATLLYHALRRDELCRLTVKDCKHERRGVRSGCAVIGEGACGRQIVPMSGQRRAGEHEGESEDEADGPHRSVSGSGSVCPGVVRLDNHALFPEICLTSGKWFRGRRELFRRPRRDETLARKIRRFQRTRSAARYAAS